MFDDEAHHIHNEKMAWFRSIRDIHHRISAGPAVAASRPLGAQIPTLKLDLDA